MLAGSDPAAGAGRLQPRPRLPIKIQFSSVLNLPARAKVDSGGVQIGVLDHVQLDGTTAVAYVDISGDSTLPGDTRAELRQATPLGDIYIALVPPEDRSGTCGDIARRRHHPVAQHRPGRQR